MTSGQWFVSADGSRWFFDAGALSLDFAYTGDWGLGQPQWERLRAVGDLTDWMRSHVHEELPPVTDTEFGRSLALRGAIVDATWGIAREASVPETAAEVIDRFAASPDIPPHLSAHARAGSATVGAALSTIARDFISSVAASPARVRQCAADDCGLVFLDNSRPGTRRWCSMERCGNRVKARQHRARRIQP